MIASKPRITKDLMDLYKTKIKFMAICIKYTLSHEVLKIKIGLQDPIGWSRRTLKKSSRNGQKNGETLLKI